MNDLNNNFLNLCLQEEIENSKTFLDILYLEIKMYKTQIEFLDSNKPYWFQKKKLKAYEKERKNLENQIDNCRNSILQELNLIKKMSDN